MNYEERKRRAKEIVLSNIKLEEMILDTNMIYIYSGKYYGIKYKCKIQRLGLAGDKMIFFIEDDYANLKPFTHFDDFLTELLKLEDFYAKKK